MDELGNLGEIEKDPADHAKIPQNADSTAGPDQPAAPEPVLGGMVERILAHPQIVHRISGHANVSGPGYKISNPDSKEAIPGLIVEPGVLYGVQIKPGSPAEELSIFGNQWTATSIMEGKEFKGDGQQLYDPIRLGDDEALVVEIRPARKGPKYFAHFALLARNLGAPGRRDFAYLINVPGGDEGKAIDQALRTHPEIMLEVLKGKYGLDRTGEKIGYIFPPIDYRLSENLHVVNANGIRPLPAAVLRPNF